jgi:hypothetical protein
MEDFKREQGNLPPMRRGVALDGASIQSAEEVRPRAMEEGSTALGSRFQVYFKLGLARR